MLEGVTAVNASPDRGGILYSMGGVAREGQAVGFYRVSSIVAAVVSDEYKNELKFERKSVRPGASPPTGTKQIYTK